MAYVDVKDYRNEIDDIYVRLKKLEKMYIKIGVFAEDEEKLLMIARVHEYGVKIKVTEKMRNYLHAVGLHLRDDTMFINIPERSFVRRTEIEKRKDIIARSKKLIDQVVLDGMDPLFLGQMIGKEVVEMVRDTIREVKQPELHPFTIEQKGSDDPLIDKGNLLNAINYKVVMWWI